MNNSIRNGLKAFAEGLGYEVRRKPGKAVISPPIELDARDGEIVEYVLSKSLSMASPQRLFATVQAARYVVETGVAGDFVECGVWRGGNALAARLVFDALGDARKVHLFDTFAGMTAPTDIDVEVGTNQKAQIEFDSSQRDDYNAWCYASLEDVQHNFAAAGVDQNSVHFVKGDVCATLRDQANLPDEIAVLRLDTDWYESTVAELEVLYPRLLARGVLLIDDYGHWEGARKAVDEYFAALEPSARPLFAVTDHTGRMGVKPSRQAG